MTSVLQLLWSIYERQDVKLKAYLLMSSILFLPCSSRAPRKHVVDTDIHFYHVPTHADASRKRIMEDTEDWRPRTGTTQSRSFKILAQITGTENGTWLTEVYAVTTFAESLHGLLLVHLSWWPNTPEYSPYTGHTNIPKSSCLLFNTMFISKTRFL